MITGLKRVWSRIRGGSVEAKAPVQSLATATRSRLQDHSPGLIWTPVTPERAKYYLEGALGGDLLSQYDLLCTMEDSWDRLTKCLNEVKNGVKRLTWQVTPYSESGNEPSPEAIEKAGLVERAMKNWAPEVGTLEYSFEDSLYHGLDALGKGISVQELHWTNVQGEWLPRAAHYVTPLQYGWNSDGSRLGLIVNGQTPEEGKRSTAIGLSGWRAAQRPGQGRWTPFPSDQFIVGQWHARTGAPGATALLRPLVPYWIGMTYGWRWLMQTAQLFGVPFRWGNYDPNQPGLKDAMAEMLENMGSSGWAAFPNGCTLNFQEAVQNARDNPQALIIELAKKACDLLILGQELSSESEAAGLGSGNAVLQGKVRQDVFHGAASWTGELLNYQFVLPVLRANYGDASEAPELAPDLSIDPDPKTKAERDQILLTSTDVKFPAKDFYERHGIRMPEDGEDVVSGRSSMGLLDGMGGLNGTGGGTDRTDRGNGTDRADETDGTEDEEDELQAKATAATEKVISKTLEDLTGVEHKWLAGVRPFFVELLGKAKDMTDEQWATEGEAVLEKARRQFPELFGKLNHQALRDHLFKSMSAACINGALKGAMRRRPRA